MQPQPAPDPSRKPLAILLWVILAIIAVPCLCFGGCMGLGVLGLAKTGTMQQTRADAAAQDLRVSGIEVEKGDVFDYVVGTVKNTSAHDYSLVGIELEEIDEKGRIVGTTSDTISELGAGRSWRFKALRSDPAAVQFQVKQVTGY